MSTTVSTPVEVSIEVDAPIEEAFDVFTRDMASWWPVEHHILQAELAEMVFEPRVGGNDHRPGCRRQRVPLGTRAGL